MVKKHDASKWAKLRKALAQQSKYLKLKIFISDYEFKRNQLQSTM